MSDPPRILLLEDDAPLRESLARVLRRRGYRVDEVGRSEDAIAAAREASYDLVVTDIKMEGIDGLEALERVKGSQPDVGSLVITGYGTEADSIRAIRLGAGDYLKKPFHLKTFLDSVETVLQGRRQERTLAHRGSVLASAAVWLLEELLALRGWRQAAQQARKAFGAALELKLPELAAVRLQLAALVRLLERHGAGPPPEVRSVLDGFEPPSEEAPLSLEERILAAVLELPTRDEEMAELVSRQAGRERPPEDLGARRRQLLWLATALQSRDAEGSRNALLAVLEHGEETREGVHASLRIGRDELARGEREEGRRRVLRAIGWARRLGPNLSCESFLEGGTLLWSHGFEEGAELVRQASRLADAVGSTPLAVLARLALEHFGGTPCPEPLALGVLAQPESTGHLDPAASWLTACLLRRKGTGEELLAALAVDHPDEFGRALQASELDAEGRLAAVAALSAAASPQAEKWLRSLLADPQEPVRSAAFRALEDLRRDSGGPRLRLYSLGSFVAFRGGERIPEDRWKTQKVRYLLAYLAAAGEREVPEEVLMEAFWPDAEPSRARKSLNTALSYLRAEVRPVPEGPDPLRRTSTGLRLNPEFPHWHDLDELTELLQGAPDGRDRLSSYRRIARLYRGPYLEGCYLDWAVERRNGLERRVADALARLTELCLEGERPEEAVEHGRRALEIDRCHQQVSLLVLQAHLRQGRPEEAVRHYELCERALREDLGMEPSTEMLRGYQRALLSLD
ncbi:MAG: response regulator [Armatimonadetes bacterium]|nr:response regulator [Armatimonadota bacterium]